MSITISYKKESPLEIEHLAKQYDNDCETNNETLDKNKGMPKYNPFRIEKLQNYNPLYSRFFEMTHSNYHKITLNQTYGIRNKQLVHRETGIPHDVPIFFKFAPLLDPIRYMVGKYDLQDPLLKTLPSIKADNTLETCFPKIADPNNVSYVDSFFCYLSSQLLEKHNVFNAVDFYGSYLGVQELFRVDVTDDIEYLQSSPFYSQNLNREFFVENYEYTKYNNGSKTNRQRIQINNSSRDSRISLGAETLDIEPIEYEYTQQEYAQVAASKCIENTETVYEKQSGNHLYSIASSASDSTQNSHELNYSSGEDEPQDTLYEDQEEKMCKKELTDENETEEEYEEDDGDYETVSTEPDDIYAYIRNFPTQMICLERCDGVLDDLLETKEFEMEQIAACLFQIVMTLIIYGKAFQFTHNDLHTNNIVYTETPEKFVYYRFQSKYYKVPTYGRIFKIIDFGRAIYRFCGKVFCSDSFAKCGDAYSQYNCEPYMNNSKPRIEPNPSFDLCRLACSMYDIVFDEDTDPNVDKLDPLQETILRWCSDDNGKNVLYKRSGEERYPGFKLYKMIARNVHKHTPEEQLKFPYFARFELSKKTDMSKIRKRCMNIDELPSYA
jgi:hypothetical protein